MKKESVFVRGIWVAFVGGIGLLVLGMLIEYYFPYPLTKIAYIAFLYGAFFLGFGVTARCFNIVFSRWLTRLDKALPGIAAAIEAIKCEDTEDYERKIYKKWIHCGRYGGFLALKVVEGPYIVELHCPHDIRLMNVYEIAEFKKFITAPFDGEEFNTPQFKKEDSSSLC